MYDFGAAMVDNWGRDGPFANFSPLLGMQMLMTRETAVAGRLSDRQAVDAPTALAMYTKYNAWVNFEEHVKGTLEPGKLADLTVLDNDPLVCHPEDVGRIGVVMTMVGGVTTYSAGPG